MSDAGEIVPFAVARALPEWRPLWSHQVHDGRYYEVIADTLGAQFTLEALVLREGDAIRAIQPVFVVDQDVVEAAPGPLRKGVGWLRCLWPGAFRMRVLMVGCPAGVGELGCRPGDEAWTGTALFRALENRTIGGEASLIVLKDFRAEDRAALGAAEGAGFVRFPSMPATRLPLTFADFDDYLRQRLGRIGRKWLRRKLRDLPGLTLEVRSEVEAMANAVHALYLQVLERAKLRFERLTPEFLIALGRERPDRIRFILWRLEGRLVACSVCEVADGVLHDLYLGMDYGVALEHSLYFRTFRDVLEWAIGQGLREYRSTPLGYDPKRRLGFELAPLDLYARHTSRVWAPLFRWLLPKFGPTRTEGILKEF